MRGAMTKRRILLGSLLAIAAALPVVAPGRADARVFFGLALGFPGVGFGFPYYAPYYYPPPVYYYPPPPPVYIPPPAAYGAPPIGDGAPSAIARCVTGTVTCPLPYVKPVGAACACPDNAGGTITGLAG